MAMPEDLDGDPYEILNIASNTEPRVIEAVYRMFVARYHPSVRPDAHAAAQLREAQWAYQLLRDPARRRAFDAARSGDSATVAEPVEHPSARREWIKHVLTAGAAVLFVGMLALVVFALYFVGALEFSSSAGAAPQQAPVIATARPLVLAAAALTLQASAGLPTATATMPALPTETPTPMPAPLAACVSSPSINVRSGPGADFAALAYLMRSECMKLIGRNAAASWVQIAEASKVEAEGGWVALAGIKADGDPGQLPVVEVETAP